MKTALIGLGRIGWQYHLPQIVKHEGFELAAVVDTNAERLQEAEAIYGVRGYADAAEMLAREAPELVVVASPTIFHRQHAMDALRAGAHVLLDKPMACTLSEAQAIADCASACGRKLMVYQPHRATPEAVAVRRVLESGLLGRVYMIKRASSGYNRRADWQAFESNGGGMLSNYGAHFIDQLLYVTGCVPEEVRCWRMREVSLGDADDVVKLIIRTVNGPMLDLDISQAAALPAEPWLILGTLGAAKLEDTPEGTCFTVRYLRPEELPPLEADERLLAKGRKYDQDASLPWRSERFPVQPDMAVDFYDRCRAFFVEGGAPFVPVEETLRVMELLEQCRSSAPVRCLQ